MEKVRRWWVKRKLLQQTENNYKLMIDNHVTVDQINFLLNDQQFMNTVLEVCEDLANKKTMRQI